MPTATPYARNAIFSGLFPMELAARHPEWIASAADDESLNLHESELLSEQLVELMGKPVPVRYEKIFTAADGQDLLRACRRTCLTRSKADLPSDRLVCFGDAAQANC